jgi:hypothetical protein
MAKPFKINISDEAIARLKTRLDLTTFPTQLEGPDVWAYGAPVKDIQRLTKYWGDGFDWRQAEAQLNEMSQFIVPIDVDGFGTLDIHYVYKKSGVNNAIPLLFVHGCK